MAKEDTINALKRQVSRDIVSDKEIVDIIDSPESKKDNWKSLYLLDTIATKKASFAPCIYRYHMIAPTVEKNSTFLTIAADYSGTVDSNSIYRNISLTIYIITHVSHMVIDSNLIDSNRNDYLAHLLDKKFSRKLPYCKFKLKSNTEGTYRDDFLYRKLVFSCEVAEDICDVD